PNPVRAGAFRRVPEIQGLYPKSKPPLLGVVLIYWCKLTCPRGTKWQRDGVCSDKTCQNKPVPLRQVGHSYYVAVEVDRIGRALFG
ncbi:MAG: hypothetical protein E7D09_07085, partial [Collinsella sp.]|nr:hypothetical protein [Collinsella sp.]